MVGSALKVSPVLESKKDNKGKIMSYFPKGTRFISLNDFTTIPEEGNQELNVNEDNKIDTIVHMREGSVLPFQNSTVDDFVFRTRDLIENKEITLLVFADKNGNAEGTLYVDPNGDSQDNLKNGIYQHYRFRFGENRLSISLQGGTIESADRTAANGVLSKIAILDMEDYKSSLLTACAFDSQLMPRPVVAEYDEHLKAVIISAADGDSLLFKDILSIQFSKAGNDSSFCNPGYVISSATRIYANEDAVKSTKLEVAITSKNPSALPNLKATFTLISDSILRVQISDPTDEKAYLGPDETFDEGFPENQPQPTIDIMDILNLPDSGEDFYYEVHDLKDAAKVYYSTKGQSFVYSQYYKKHQAILDTNGRIFGLGERVGNFFLDEGIYTLWNRDEPSPTENGRRPGNNIYGTHPVYFTQTTSKDFFGVFDHNVGAQDYIIKKVENGKYSMTQVKTSGVTDQFIILNTGIQQVINNFIEIVGKPAMVPEWSLGWHQCRYGYNSSTEVQEVVDGFISNNIPLDVMWTDIDYMDMYKDFTVSEEHFSDLDTMVGRWRADHDIRYIPILDAAVAYEPGSKGTSYSRGSSKNVFIKDPNDKSLPFIGKVWPGQAVYIDWLKEGAEEYWVKEMDELHSEVPFDGMWIDMNEASNFCDGICFSDQAVDNPIQDRLFYTPGSRDLNVKSISIDALHDTGNTEYEVHSTYGFYMSKATHKWFAERNLRQFVITRSTYAGSGKYVSHWLGDNFANYELLRLSISGIFQFGMYGIPVAGADICGFIGDTNPDLCARWYALGAFYPFSRNHNDKDAISQEPFVEMFKNRTMDGKQNSTYTNFIREAAIKRYGVHAYQYSYTHQASVDGTPYFTPIFYRYPEDELAYSEVEQNVMLGESLKLSPVVYDSTDKKFASFYFPEKGALWCPLWPKTKNQCIKGETLDKQFILPHDEILLHIKSGSIIPMHFTDLESAPKNINLEGLENIPIDLAVHPEASKFTAKGWYRWDDGETLDLQSYTQVEFNSSGFAPTIVGKSYLDISVNVVKNDHAGKVTNSQNIGSVVVYNSKALSLSANSKATLTSDAGTSEATVEYDSTNQICKFTFKEEGGIPLLQVKSIHIDSK